MDALDLCLASATSSELPVQVWSSLGLRWYLFGTCRLGEKWTHLAGLSCPITNLPLIFLNQVCESLPGVWVCGWSGQEKGLMCTEWGGLHIQGSVRAQCLIILDTTGFSAFYEAVSVQLSILLRPTFTFNTIMRSTMFISEIICISPVSHRVTS